MTVQVGLFGPGRKPRRPISTRRGSIHFDLLNDFFLQKEIDASSFIVSPNQKHVLLPYDVQKVNKIKMFAFSFQKLCFLGVAHIYEGTSRKLVRVM